MRLNRAPQLSGVAFAVFFIASVMVSNVPSNTAGDHAWIAAYSTHAKQAGHLGTGVLLVLAALSLVSFLTDLWTRVRAAGQPDTASPLPIVAAGVAAACIAAGGVVMAASSGSALIYSQPTPGADVLRLSNDVGFALVGVAGMLAAALSITTLSAQARAAGLFGTGLWRFSLVVSIALLASVAFLPILALVIWLLVVTVTLRRVDGSAVRAGQPRGAARDDTPTLPARA